MIRKITPYLAAILFLMSAGNLMAKENDSLYHVSASIGAGYGHFFNNFENIASSEITENNPAFVGRIMWEPDNRLSIGFESGYYYLFSIKDHPSETGADKMNSSMYLVPIFLNLTMRVFDNFYVSYASGYSVMNYHVESNEGASVGSDLSLSNFAAALSYMYELSNNWDLGAEFRYMRLGLTEDDYVNLNVFIKFDFLNY